MDNKSVPQSPELAGGAGFTFEGGVGGYYLSALLIEGYAPGIDNKTVSRVSFQQRDFGEPLDDVIVDFRSEDAGEARLSLQAKSDLTISAAASNKDFRNIIRDSWLTYTKPNFRKGIDRYGAAVGNIAKDRARALRTLCELARESDTAEHFEARFAEGGNASAEQASVKENIVSLLKEVKGAEPTGDEIQGFLAHFVLIEFDFMHAGAVHTAEVMNRLRDFLVSDQVDQAPFLWAKLWHMARDSAGKAGVYNRTRLLREISTIARLRGAVSLRADLETITALSKTWLKDISNDVGGVQLQRKSLVELLKKSREDHRFVQITGLPGNGKSVLLRQQVEADLGRGHVLFLKYDRMEGKGWNGFAQANGLSNAPLENLLAEISATGSDTLYIDGIDRVERVHQQIVLDVLRAITNNPNLSNWKVVASLRDTGIEPLRNWLAEVFRSLSIGTASVDELDDLEAEILAKEKPVLRPLLFGNNQVRKIVRRPFFAKVLQQRFDHDGNSSAFLPQSELDLVDNWWELGGYSAAGQKAIERQRAIIDIVSNRVRNLSKPVKMGDLKPESIQQIDDLVLDGILQHVRKGHTIRFSHDIFFEWAFFHLLIDREDDWLEAIRTAGEPPAIARSVELLSQWEFKQGGCWTGTLHKIAAAKMRSQWTRAWLLGPLGFPFFDENAQEFSDATFANSCDYLKKALVWCQAEKTTPDAAILASDIPVAQRIRTADLLGQPSDYWAWRRFIEFLLARINDIPVVLYPHVVSIFEVWQNALFRVKNPISRALLAVCADWLIEIDGLENNWNERKSSRWDGLEATDEFRQSLSTLVLLSAASIPEFAERYLIRVSALDQIDSKKYAEIVRYSPILATTHPRLLTELALKHLREELPDERVAREKREFDESIERRNRLLAMPEEQLTRFDRMMIESGGSNLHHFHDFSYHDWESLCIDGDMQFYWPPSPLREPFYSLFKTSPEFALQLFTELCNHAVSAWCQLHKHDYEKQGTPIPLEIRFPWGVQQFWGNDRQYLWCRGICAPHALASGFMALEDWCFSELDRGCQIEDLVQRVVNKNQSIAILGIAATLILQTDNISETSFPLVMSQRLWPMDLNRMVQEPSHRSSSLMGFNRGDEGHIAAIKRANERPVRKKSLHWLVPNFVFSSEFGEKTRQTGLGFKNSLPYSYEEQKDSAEYSEVLREKANEYAEVCLKENYQAYKSAQHPDEVEVIHVSPSASEPKNVEKMEQAGRSLGQMNLWVWASKSLEDGVIPDYITIPAAVDYAKKIDHITLFEGTEEHEDIGINRGAVAATAALVLTFQEGRSADELAWAREILSRAFATPEIRDATWIPQVSIPWHQGIFVARGLASDARYGFADHDSKVRLLTLVAHPLEDVSLAALSNIAGIWDTDSKLFWASLLLAFDLCRIEPTPSHSPRRHGDATHTPERTRDALSASIDYYEQGSGWPEFPLPPPAWIKREINLIPDNYTSDDEIEFDQTFTERDKEFWDSSPTHWYSQYSSKVLALIPLDQIMRSEAKDDLLMFLRKVLEWTNEKNSPPWERKGGRNDRSTRLYEWTHQLGSTLGGIAGYLSADDLKENYLETIFNLGDEECWALLTPFSSSYICLCIYDAKSMPDDAVKIIGLCLDRFLKSPAFKPNSYNAGKFYGSDESRLAEILMFVSIEHAGLAARYINGNWSEIGIILPLIDKYVRAGGWTATVMSHFLTLCERSQSEYPAETFADQILAIVEDNTRALVGWGGSYIPARIASLVQFFADRETPMPSVLSQKFLRILDLLIDMGDRRSAALQLSEVFREVKIAN